MHKIVFIIEQLSGGGAERVTAVLANEMSKRPDTEAHVVVYRRDDCDYPVSEKVFLHNMDIAEGQGHQIQQKLKYLKGVFAEICPTCVISLSGPGAAAVAAAAAIRSRIPLILSERNDPQRYPGSRLLRIIRLAAYLVADGLVFQTCGARDYFPAPIRKKGVVIGNPISQGLPECFEGKRERRIVNWCRLNAQKNLDLLIDAFGAVAEEFSEYTLCIYGEGPEKDRLRKKIEQLGLEERIALPGFSSHIFEEAHRAALFVSSSDYEGISNSMLEALGMGIPSICTDCPPGGARETIKDGVNGILVPVGDKMAMSKAIRRVLSDETLARSISQEGCQLKETLSCARITQQWMDLIERTSKHTR